MRCSPLADVARAAPVCSVGGRRRGARTLRISSSGAGAPPSTSPRSSSSDSAFRSRHGSALPRRRRRLQRPTAIGAPDRGQVRRPRAQGAKRRRRSRHRDTGRGGRSRAASRRLCARRAPGRARCRGALRHDPRRGLRADPRRRPGRRERSRSSTTSHLSSAPLDVAAAADLVAEAGIDDPHGVVAATLAALGDLALAHPRISPSR